jgi:hypothetical protein
MIEASEAIGEDGYPTEEALEAIRQWDLTNAGALFDFVESIWSRLGLVVRNGTIIELITGGWSGNEDIVNALKANPIGIWCWVSSNRNGSHVFEAPLAILNGSHEERS